MRAALVLTVTLSLLAAPSAVSGQQVSPDYYAGMRWRNIGPIRSGYISAVAGIPGDPTTYYVGTPEGGVWKSTSGGTTWFPVFDDVHIASIGAVAVAASDPRVVYVGTGNQSGWSFTPGNGVYKSTDAGAHWSRVGLAGSEYIGAIMVDPRNPNTALVACLGPRAGSTAPNAERGVYRTTDGGRSWQHVLGDGSSGASDLMYDFDDPLVVYAVMQGAGGGRGGAAGAAAVPVAAGTGVFKSIDGGVTWKELSGQGLPDGARGFGLAVASGTHGRRLYAEVRGGARGAGAGGGTGIFRSEDGGDSWQLGTRQIASAGGHIYADPKNPDAVYLMGTSMYRSTDGGRHFVSFMGAPSGDDPRYLWIDPTNPRRMLGAIDQGATISVDGGETWSGWYNIINGQLYRVSTDHDFPYHVCGPQQDSGTMCVLSRSDFGEIRPNDEAPAGGFENGFIVTDPLNSRWIYTQGWYHVLRRFDRITSQVSVLYTPATTDRFGGAPPLAFSPQDPHTLYMGAQYLLASSDNAQTWRQISPDLTTVATRPDSTQTVVPGRRTGPVVGGSIQSLAPSTKTAGEIWVGTGSGLVQLTRDGGKTWKNVTPANLPGGGINIIDASHASPGTAYFAILSRDNQPHIFRTRNWGGAWQEIVDGLPAGGLARVVREDPVDPNILYAGTVTGAYVSFDRGDHWQSLQLNLPTTVISDLDVHGSDLVISTYGRGFWILDDVSPLRQARSAMAATTPAYLFAPEPASRIRWDNTQDTPLPKETTTGENPPEGAIIDYYLKAPATGPISLTISDASGNVIRQFTNSPPPQGTQDTLMPNVPEYWFKPPVVLSTTAGMHRIAWDLRYADPEALPYGYSGTFLTYAEFTLNWHSIPGQTPRSQPVGPLVTPGTYTVKLTAGGQTLTRQLTVVADPRVGVSQVALDAQLLLERRMVAGLAASSEGFIHIQRLHEQLASIITQAATKPESAQLIAAARSMDAALSQIANGPPGGLGPSNRDLARRLTDMEYGDVRPSSSVIAAVETNCRDTETALASLHALETTGATDLNGLLARAGLTRLSVWFAPTPGTVCQVPSVRRQ